MLLVKHLHTAESPAEVLPYSIKNATSLRRFLATLATASHMPALGAVVTAILADHGVRAAFGAFFTGPDQVAVSGVACIAAGIA
ncbi:MAG: hypothetical protein Q4G39_03690, partial [Brachymonas sp.]|nr:hypothetical protein [Brachymonas sp.]